ncbi:MAG: LytR C-terminal domain-containing protein [Anaerolineales bacterium]
MRIVNHTYASGLGERTAGFLTAQGMNVLEQGIPTGAADQTVLVCMPYGCQRQLEKDMATIRNAHKKEHENKRVNESLRWPGPNCCA